ncbi:MAG: hypothetical protein ABI353_22935 [Isosphaeraceae bacterium]
MLGKSDDQFRDRAGLTLAMAAGDSDAYKPYIANGLRSNDQDLRSWALMAASMTQMRTQSGPQTGPTRLIVQRGLVLIAVISALAMIGLFIQLALSATRTKTRPSAPDPAPAPTPKRIFVLNYPRRIQLRPIAEPTWTDPTAIAEQVEALQGLNFSDVGPFEIADLPGVRLWGLVNPTRAITAAVQDHPEWGIFLVLKTVYQDGTTYRQTSTHRLDRPDQRPGHEFVYVEATDIPARLARFLAERPDRPMRPVALNEFAADFERDHADTVDWRFARGTMTDREIRDLNQVKGNEVTNAQVAELRHKLIQKGNSELDKSLRERFLDSRRLTGEERAKLGPSLVIVHDALPVVWVWEWFPTLIDDEFHAENRVKESALYDESLDGESAPDQAPSWQTLPPRLSFVALNERLGPEARFEKLGALDWPIEADVYMPQAELASVEHDVT